jgi:helicase
VIVVDEVQAIVDPTRRPRLEFLLTLLRARRGDGVSLQVVALSAVLSDLGGLDTWLDARVLVRTERPVPLAEGVLRVDGTWRFVDPAGEAEREEKACVPEYRKGSAQDVVIALVRRLVGEGRQILVFGRTRSATRSCAAYLSRALGFPPATEALEALPSRDPSVVTRELRGCLAGVVAFHNSDLDRHEMLAVEQAFRAHHSTLKSLTSTTPMTLLSVPVESRGHQPGSAVGPGP